MKKYTISEMLKMDNCRNIKCVQCPFHLEKRDKKYDCYCKAEIYCRKNNIFDFYNTSSEIYIKYLKKLQKTNKFKIDILKDEISILYKEINRFNKNKKG